MFGLGSAEAGIILVVALVLFAPTLVAFWVGYTMGQRKSASEPARDGEQSPVPTAESQQAVSNTGPTEGDEPEDE